MKLRSCVLVWMISVALPVVLGAVGLDTGDWGTPIARAQQPDAVTTLARERFIEGVKVYDAGRYEEARSLFLQAYALKRHPAVLLNLGQAEIKSGHVVAGGNHLQQFLREHKTATPDQQNAAKAGIADARRRVGHIIVIVDVDGAAVAVDGNAAGKSPLLDPVFVAPGEHRITATLSGKTAVSPVVAKRGSATPVNLSLRALGVQPSATPTPTPTPTATAAPTSTYPAPGPGVPPPGPAPAPTSTMPGPTPMPMPPPGGGADTGRDNFFDWFTNKPIAWVLTGVAGLGLVGTIAFGAAASSADSSADSVSDQISSEVARTNNLPDSYYDNGDSRTGQAQPCGDRENPATAYPYYADACASLVDNLDAYDTDIALMGVSIGLLAGGAAGVVIYYFADPDNPEQSAKSGPRIVGAAPIVTPFEQGFGLLGTF